MIVYRYLVGEILIYYDLNDLVLVWCVDFMGYYNYDFYGFWLLLNV